MKKLALLRNHCILVHRTNDHPAASTRQVVSGGVRPASDGQEGQTKEIKRRGSVIHGFLQNHFRPHFLCFSNVTRKRNWALAGIFLLLVSYSPIMFTDDRSVKPQDPIMFTDERSVKPQEPEELKGIASLRTNDPPPTLHPRDMIMINNHRLGPVVIEEFKMLFFRIPKVGTTEWNSMFRRMMGLKGKSGVNY
jgi:hypothetical protein